MGGGEKRRNKEVMGWRATERGEKPLEGGYKVVLYSNASGHGFNPAGRESKVAHLFF